MKWATLFHQFTNTTYAGIFPASMGKRQIEDSFRRKIKREANKRGDKNDLESWLDGIKDCVEINSMKEGRVYEADNFGEFVECQREKENTILKRGDLKASKDFMG